MGERQGVRESIERSAAEEKRWREERRKAVGVDPLTGKKDVPSLEQITKDTARDWNKHGDG